ncbi:hypothetical protein SGQ44_11195 [Flavobacterium sp. Fl-77]|uniref:Uncharacterized protein n=1 Tax=Flavobacterium flavipigmentatum TaxID=2893884 RepID=A0AAJ2VXK6_9FLAO|nr:MULTISPECIES: hypothetical protein [unclassified Flavobacterium]MDX6182875.1 hypothetical protein [Flavobacterium sp. Fl-33]MDX6186328.1 hypothetical protein [Flavobacterium sp. Fl-77]UFH37883.1 hypothetical protein LNP22_14205 [Flavobacterium sp. F-70]
MNKKSLILLAIVFFFLTQISYSQFDEKRTKIEISIKDGNKTIIVPVRSSTVSFSRSANSVKDTENSNDLKNYYLSIDFEKQDINLLRAFAKNKTGIDGELTMIDIYGKAPSRKFEFKGATLDALSDQLNGDYSSSYFSLNCRSLIIDGVTLE